MFHRTCIKQIRNIQNNQQNALHCYDILYSHFSHQYILAAVVAIYRVMFVLQE